MLVSSRAILAVTLIRSATLTSAVVAFGAVSFSSAAVASIRCIVASSPKPPALDKYALTADLLKSVFSVVVSVKAVSPFLISLGK